MQASSKIFSLRRLDAGSQRTTMPSHLISSLLLAEPGKRGSTMVSETLESGARK